MSATDWETRELESASRERLLTEIGLLQKNLADTTVSALENQVSELQIELLSAKDFAMGAASRAGEAQAQLGAAQARVAFLSKHINRMRNSTTWKLGRIVMLPVRVIKKVTGKSA